MIFTLRFKFILVFLIGLCAVSYAQKRTRIMVVDSATFKPLPAVLVQVKHTDRAHIVDPTGIFTIITKPSDTLIISHIGYKYVTLPLLFEDDAIIVRMSEQLAWLKEVTVTARKLYPNELNPRISKQKSTRSGMISVPWDYFSRHEKDKRKVNELMEENDRIRTFVEVITDPSVKAELMIDYDLSEDAYYDTLVKFNKQKFPVIYSNDADAIINALHDFFEVNSK